MRHYNAALKNITADVVNKGGGAAKEATLEIAKSFLCHMILMAKCKVWDTTHGVQARPRCLKARPVST